MFQKKAAAVRFYRRITVKVRNRGAARNIQRRVRGSTDSVLPVLRGSGSKQTNSFRKIHQLILYRVSAKSQAAACNFLRQSRIASVYNVLYDKVMFCATDLSLYGVKLGTENKSGTATQILSILEIISTGQRGRPALTARNLSKPWNI